MTSAATTGHCPVIKSVEFECRRDIVMKGVGVLRSSATMHVPFDAMLDVRLLTVF